MAANYEAVKLEAKRYVSEACLELPIEKAFIFGSYAKGVASELSDVDIAFFVKDFGNHTRHEIGMELLKLTQNYKAYFEPLVFPSSEIMHDNPFVNEILRTGQEVIV